MKEYPGHPGSGNMVPCLKCGRYICHICETTGSVTHYCPICAPEFLDQLKVWWFVLGILLPSAAIAMFIGVWPFPHRPYWRGFNSE